MNKNVAIRFPLDSLAEEADLRSSGYAKQARVSCGIRIIGLLALSLLFVPAAVSAGADQAAAARVRKADAGFGHTWVLHLPGIAGERWPDVQMTGGLKDAGYDGAVEIYDWTENDPGLSALVSYKRNQAQAQIIADKIAEHFRADPHGRIVLTGHSGGTGLAVWALEKLPEDVKVDTLLLLASALSPGYDLSKALSHVTGKCYAFCSENDVLVLGAGTRMFGTIDGKKSEAAGNYGFFFPENADAGQYEKLVQKPYDREWTRYRNPGDHVGCMARHFSTSVIAPLLFPGLKPPEVRADERPGPRRPPLSARQPVKDSGKPGSRS